MTQQQKPSIEELATFCKKKGFVYPSSELYGGLAGFYDYGPLGVELKNNIKQEFWKTFVQSRQDMLGLDGSIISHQRIWEASGHLTGFSDMLLECLKCKNKLRADQFIEEKLKISAGGITVKELSALLKKHKLTCPKCKSQFADIKDFNLMFPIKIGTEDISSSTAYLRGETAQLIFAAFDNVVNTSRVKLPFGIAQIGKAFRNEIAPRNFLFRLREFEQAEIEYFIHPKKDYFPYTIDKALKVNFLPEKFQAAKKPAEKVLLNELVKKKTLSEWHAYWLQEITNWFTSLGINPENLRIREHTKSELSHYSKATFDIEYNFPGFGFKEIHGCADRQQFDLTQHQTHSKKQLGIFDEATKERIIPKVIEPSQGIDRAFLTFLYEAYEYDKQRENVVLHLHPRLAPIKAAIFPLLSNKEELTKKAEEVFQQLKDEFHCFYDDSGSIGRRYARMDEAGCPFAITIDFDSLKQDDVTIRDRDTTAQIRLPIEQLKETLNKLLKGEEKLEDFGINIK